MLKKRSLKIIEDISLGILVDISKSYFSTELLNISRYLFINASGYVSKGTYYIPIFTYNGHYITYFCFTDG